jgi:HEAT repeat protein
VLTDLDALDWAALGSATGSAVGVPALLRAVAAGAEPAASAALADLVNELYHQETVWGCTEPAVPFLVELALTPSVSHRDSLVYLLAGLSRSAVAGAVDAHVPRLVDLLADPDEQVREYAAYLVGWHAGHAKCTVPVLMRRWVDEREPLVRASVLAAVGALDCPAGRSLAGKALRDRDPAVRAAGGLVLVWMRQWWSKRQVPLPKHAAAIVAEAFANANPLHGWVWTSNAVCEVLDGFEDVEGARGLMVGLMVRSPSADVRGQAAREIEDRNRGSRSAPAELVPLLSPLLTDPDARVRWAAATTVSRAGSAATLVADEVALLAEALGRGEELAGAAERALATLIELDDPRWRLILPAVWRQRQPRETVAKALATATPPADQQLLTAVTGRLTEINPLDGARGERDSLAVLVSGWGPVAAAAAPALTAALDREVARDRPVPGSLCRALGAMGPAARPAVPALHIAALRSFHSHDRMRAGLAAWRLTGEAAPALKAAAGLLDGPNGYDDARGAWLYPASVKWLHPIGTQLAPLIPSLRQHLSQYPDRHEANCEIARLLWQLNGDPDEVLPVLRAALSIAPRSRHDYTNHPPSAAMQAAAELGEHAAPLIGQLHTALDNPVAWVRVAAATALWRLGAAREDELVAVIVPDPNKAVLWRWIAAEPALDLITEMRAQQAVNRLAGWLTTDQRVHADQNDAVRLDELFQARVRQLLTELV